MAESIKAITNIPSWSTLLGASDKISSANTAYAAVPLIYRAVKFRCNILSSVPTTLLKGDREVDWIFSQKLNRLIWLTEAGLLLEGYAFWHKESNALRPVDLAYINPTSMTVDYDQNTGRFEFTQTVDEHIQKFQEEEIVYFREYDPVQDISAGVAPAKVALNAARLSHYQARFASYFFEGGAQPLTILGLENTVSEKERERVEGALTRALTGIRNAFRIIALRSEVKPTVLTPPLSNLAMPELSQQARQSIADAFELPLPLLENPANRSVTEELRLSFWQDTMKPRGELLVETINDQLLNPLGYELRMEFNEMDIFQTDEAERSNSLEGLVRAGIPLKLAMQVLGYDLSEEQWEILDEAILQKQQNAAALQAQFNQGGRDQPEEEEEEEEKTITEIRRELRRWERTLLKDQRKGLPLSEFKSNILSEALQGAITGALEHATDSTDINRVFRDAHRWAGYP